MIAAAVIFALRWCFSAEGRAMDIYIFGAYLVVFVCAVQQKMRRFLQRQWRRFHYEAAILSQ